MTRQRLVVAAVFGPALVAADAVGVYVAAPGAQWSDIAVFVLLLAPTVLIAGAAAQKRMPPESPVWGIGTVLSTVAWLTLLVYLAFTLFGRAATGACSHGRIYC